MIEKQLTHLANKYSYHVLFPSYIYDNNYKNIKKDIFGLKNTLVTKARLLESKHTDEQIKLFTDKRCDDYTTNKGAMINSCLEKDNKKIVIDRLLKTIDGVEHLITDPAEIRKLTNEHFQTCPGGIHELKIIPTQWIAQYSPQDHIDTNIYHHLMDPPSLEEWSQVIKQLPINKATGPSGISNEMLKHLGPSR